MPNVKILQCHSKEIEKCRNRWRCPAFDIENKFIQMALKDAEGGRGGGVDWKRKYKRFL